MRRLVGLLLASALAAGLADCGARREENVITFWHAMGRWSPALTAMIEEYNALHPELPVRAYDMSRYQALSQKIIAAVAAGQPPTISQAYEAWTAEMIEAGIIECLEPYADGERGDAPLTAADLADIQPVFLDECRYAGKLWSFPFNKSVRTLYLNRDLFQAAGLDPDRPPATP
ncbi:extracellular solute-binding protein, partial [bacterium]|nr:extracellular solute-binding protein [bacterium]